MKKNSCYTYFTISGDFKAEEVTKLLNLEPYQQWNIGDLRQNGTAYDFARWSYGLCEEYDVLVREQMKQTIQDLIPKIEILKEIKQKYDVSFYLKIVPNIYSEVDTPYLGADSEIIDFCYQTGTEIDIDLYVFMNEN